MSRVRALPWAVSFADLALLLLGCFVILFAARARLPAAGKSPVEAAEPAAVLETGSGRLFEPGEARLTPAARASLQAIGRRAAAGGHGVRVESRGKDAAARRFDGWELAAARTAAAARAIGEGGVAESRIAIVMPDAADEGGKGHRLAIRLSP